MTPDYIKEENGRFVVRVVFGTDNVRAYENGEVLSEASESSEIYRKNEFTSLEAAEAYLMGIADMDGWYDYLILYNGEREPNERK